jgi:ribonuclease-3
MGSPPSIAALGERLGISFTDPDLIARAFVHSSYFNENPTLVDGHNERLEFLGDAVIGIVVSRLLFERYPEEDEGFLTARRAALVNREALASMALEIGLDRHMLLGRGEAYAGGATRPSLLAASFEALAGALALSEGVESATTVLEPIFRMRLEGADDGPPKSAKSRLQEYTQRHLGLKPAYQVLSTSGPPHEQQFTVAVGIKGRRLAEGAGSSRQRAEEQAAAAALAELPEDPDSTTPSAS